MSVEVCGSSWCGRAEVLSVAEEGPASAEGRGAVLTGSGSTVLGMSVTAGCKGPRSATVSSTELDSLDSADSKDMDEFSSAFRQSYFKNKES